MQRGCIDPSQGKDREVQRGERAAVAGQMRHLLGQGVGRLLRGHGVHNQGVLHIQGKF